MRLFRFFAVLLCCAGSLGISAICGCSTGAAPQPDAPNPPLSSVPATPDPFGSVAFLQGLWRGHADGGVWEEFWTSSEGGVMTGTARLIVHDRVVFFEFSRIERRGDEIVMIVQPKGGAPTEFVRDPAVERVRALPNLNEREQRQAKFRSGNLVTDCQAAAFENPSHDYPRRITYARVPGPTRHRLEVRLIGVESGIEKQESLSLQFVAGQASP